MPRNHDAPSHREIAAVVEAHPWRDRLRPLHRPFPVADAPALHRELAPLATDIDIWETEYLHVLQGPDPVAEWTRGTGLRAILDALDEAERDRFLEEYRRRLRIAYPPEADGRTLFPFRRIFIVATR
jgi:trans-aconitate 2-methyltransferase